MVAHPDPVAFADDILSLRQDKSLLRLIAYGSVDHGKSSLLGRLLYETRSVFDDQIEALAGDTLRQNPHAEEPDFSLLLDGLSAEREQRITIDVAYRFFSTGKRKFILADAPGHEQYTRNMATGASTADIALLLIDVKSGLTAQTKRHALIVSALGVRHLVVAVNKMDLAGWSQEAFLAVTRAFTAFARGLAVAEIAFVPTAARRGDNVVRRSAEMPWYRGPTLLEYLEQVEIPSRAAGGPFRFPVQWVNRPSPDFRGYSGLIARGKVAVGQTVRILPSGVETRIARIVTADGDLASAVAGQSVTLVLAEEVDVSRGDVIAASEHAPLVTDRLQARLLWTGQAALVPGQRYFIKIGTCAATATVGPSLSLVDLDSQASRTARQLLANEIGLCELRLDRLVAVDRYTDSRETGGLILIDPESYDTVALGLVEGGGDGRRIATGCFGRLLRGLTERGAFRPLVPMTEETHARSVAKAISWRVTGSLDTFLLGFLITGSTVLAGSVALSEIVTKIVLYYWHERIWSAIAWGRR